MNNTPTPGSFAELDLPPFLLKALGEVGYEAPSSIQALTIPPLLAGRDMVGQAQTGTGKTAAFALPVLATLDPSSAKPQALVLAPTRELAIQVAEAFQKYARHLDGFRVLPIYGGSDYRAQLRTLSRGVQVVVGTPGRVMDHMRRGSLDLSALRTLVLDEADEMLRMGFIDDVEWILEQTPAERQIALFSATLPEAIRRIAGRQLRAPAEISIRQKTVTNAAIRQRVWMMSGVHKLDALTRILETEDTDGVIIFVRTRLATQELADKLAARGFTAAALNGDIPQAQREKTVDRLKAGGLDIVVATDVAARGLDVERVSHVINYDIPNDPEAYVHRIGRTGRAGRSGEAILFAANRERRLLRAIERATGQPIEPMALPTADDVTDRRAARFKARITETLASQDLASARRLVEDYQQEFGVPVIEVAAALVLMSQGDARPAIRGDDAPQAKGGDRDGRRAGGEDDRVSAVATGKKRDGPEAPARPNRGRGADGPESGFERYRIEVGRQHGVRPGNIVGAIANEAEVDAEYIGRIQIFDDHSLVDLPEGMPKEIYRHLQSVWVSGQKLRLSRADSAAAGTPRKAGRPKDGAKKAGLKKAGPKKAGQKKPGKNQPGRNKPGPRRP